MTLFELYNKALDMLVDKLNEVGTCKVPKECPKDVENITNSVCKQCIKDYFLEEAYKEGTAELTNKDYLATKDDIEIAKLISSDLDKCNFCTYNKGDEDCQVTDCYIGILRWLKAKHIEEIK